MEPPTSFEADAVRDEKAKVLHAIQPLTPEDVLSRTVRGQYGEGCVTGEHAPRLPSRAQRRPPDSHTETFVALKLQVDNWRWADVPFYLRTGKRLASRVTEIAIQFRRAPVAPLPRHRPSRSFAPNLLVLHIQPDEGISLRFGAKVPGPLMQHGSRGDGLQLRATTSADGRAPATRRCSTTA